MQPPVESRGGWTLQVKRLAKSFGESRVLDGVDLYAPAGRLVAVLGPSGCGKTTLLRIVAGLERPDEGSVTVGDDVMTEGSVFVAPERRRVGMVFQDWALFPHMTVADNVAFGLPRHGDRRVRETLRMVGLERQRDSFPGVLSGGQQQRVALARALAPRPRVLLLDEPFSNLDAALRSEVRAEVRRLLADLEITAVFVTHDQEEAFALGDEVAVLADGRILQQATPDRLYARPVSPWLARFVGEANLVKGAAQGNRAQTVLGTLPLVDPPRGQVEVLVRPEWLHLSPGRGAVIEEVEFYGHDTAYRIRLESGDILRSRAMATPLFRTGDAVRVTYAGPPTVAYRGAGDPGR